MNNSGKLNFCIKNKLGKKFQYPFFKMVIKILEDKKL